MNQGRRKQLVLFHPNRYQVSSGIVRYLHGVWTCQASCLSKIKFDPMATLHLCCVSYPLLVKFSWGLLDQIEIQELSHFHPFSWIVWLYTVYSAQSYTSTKKPRSFMFRNLAPINKKLPVLKWSKTDCSRGATLPKQSSLLNPSGDKLRSAWSRVAWIVQS